MNMGLKSYQMMKIFLFRTPIELRMSWLSKKKRRRRRKRESKKRKNNKRLSKSFCNQRLCKFQNKMKHLISQWIFLMDNNFLYEQAII